MSMGYGKARCCVDYCDAVGAVPIQLLTKLHVFLCNQHALEWRANHRGGTIQTAAAHMQWKAWLKECGARAWMLQSQERKALEHMLAEKRRRLRYHELVKFKAELEASMERTVTATSNTQVPSLASRALKQVAGVVRSALYSAPDAGRTPTMA